MLYIMYESRNKINITALLLRSYTYIIHVNAVTPLRPSLVKNNMFVCLHGVHPWIVVNFENFAGAASEVMRFKRLVSKPKIVKSPLTVA